MTTETRGHGTLRIAVRKYPPFEEAISQQFASFRAATGCDVDLEVVPLDVQPLRSTLFEEDGLTNGDWDLAFIVTDWIAEAIERKCLLDLNLLGVLAPDADGEAWVSSLREPQRQGAAFYGMPYHDGPECLILKGDLFENAHEQANFARKYGRPLTAPATWAEFRQVAEFFTRPEQGLYGTVFSTFPDGHNTLYDFCLQTWNRGGEIWNDRRWLVDEASARDGLAWYRDMARNGLVYPDPVNVDSVRAGALFAEGRAAMMINWFGFATACELPDSALRGRVRIAPIPCAEGFSSATLSVYWGISIPVGSARPAVAFEFLRHLATPEMDKLATRLGVVGCRRSTWNDPEIRARQPFFAKLEQISTGARTLPRSRHLPEFAAIIDRVMTRTVTDNAPIEEIVAEAQHRADSLA